MKSKFEILPRDWFCSERFQISTKNRNAHCTLSKETVEFFRNGYFIRVINLIQMTVKKYVAVQLGVIYMTPQATNRRERGLTSCRSCSWPLHLHLERARDREGGSDIAWCAEGGKQAHMLAEPGAENGQFPALVGLKITKNTVFTQKNLIRYTVKMFFEEYIKLKKIFTIKGIVELYLFKVLGVIQYMPPAIQIRVNMLKGTVSPE
jgi:hypothetical protein